MKLRLILIFILISKIGFNQKTNDEILIHRKNHLNKLKDINSGILNAEEIEKFRGLDYYDYDSKFQINAVFKKQKGPKFEMATSTERKPIYRRYGIITFNLDGKKFKLEVYQNIKLIKSKEYKNYLFVPFRDKTSGNESYGVGRYLDLKKQKGNMWLIDFNLSYNPYCAYSYRYSCPIPPMANTLNVSIKAGEKKPHQD